MAATFIVEDGSGKSNANSYVSVADADQYHENASASTDWSGAEESVKEQALRLATQYLDAQYGGRWRGTKASRDQALAWPRSYAYDDDDYLYDSDAIPQKLADAASELALRVIEGDTLLDDISEPGIVKSESVTLGPLEKDVEYMGGKSQVKDYSLIRAQLKALLQPRGVERG